MILNNIWLIVDLLFFFEEIEPKKIKKYLG